MDPPDVEPGASPSDGGRDVRSVLPEGPGRRPAIVLVAVAVVLAVVVLKPWGDGETPQEPSPRPRPSAPDIAATTPAPAPSARPWEQREPGGPCVLGTAWRLFTIEVDAGHPVVSWVSIEPVRATGPEDRSIPAVRVIADSVSALGFCAIVGPDGPRAIDGVMAWAVPASGPAVALGLEPLAAWMPSDPGVGRVYRPPASAETPGAWAPGRYVFVVRYGPSSADQSWYGVEIASPPAPRTPPASPAPGSPIEPASPASAMP